MGIYVKFVFVFLQTAMPISSSVMILCITSPIISSSQDYKNAYEVGRNLVNSLEKGYRAFLNKEIELFNIPRQERVNMVEKYNALITSEIVRTNLLKQSGEINKLHSTKMQRFIDDHHEKFSVEE